MIRKKKKKLKKFLRNREMSTYEEYRQCKVEARKMLRKKKRENFMNFV